MQPGEVYKFSVFTVDEVEMLAQGHRKGAEVRKNRAQKCSDAFARTVAYNFSTATHSAPCFPTLLCAHTVARNRTRPSTNCWRHLLC